MPTVTLENREPDDGLKLDRILVPVDFSANSETALRHALTLLRAGADPIEVLHVWNVASFQGARPVEVADGEEPLAMYVSEQVEQSMDAFLDRVVGVGKDDARLRPVLESGDATTVIVARSGQYDAIFLGAHTVKEGVAEILFGNVAEGIIADASCPVFTVRP